MQINIIIAAVVTLTLHMSSHAEVPSGVQSENRTDQVDMKAITTHFDLMIDHWTQRGVVKMLICPVILGGPDDPFDNKKKLSSASFGVLSEDDSRNLIKLIKEGKKEILPVIDQGIDYDIIIINKHGDFSEIENQVRCRVLTNDLVIFFLHGKNEYAIKLPKTCFELFKACIVNCTK